MSARNEEYFLIESSSIKKKKFNFRAKQDAIVRGFTPLRKSIIIEEKLQKNTE